MPGPNGAYNRLLNLLYEKTAPEVLPRVPKVKRLLYESETTGSHSALDGLMQFEWKQKPLESAVEEVEKLLPKVPKSFILRMSCKNSYIGRSDFHNIYPVSAERQFLLRDTLKKGMNFQVVKGRNPFTFSFLGSYFLIFPNHNQACVYYLETLSKQLNGFHLKLTFVPTSESVLKRVSSPILRDLESNFGNAFEESAEKFDQLPISQLFAGSQDDNQLIKVLTSSSEDRSQYTGLNIDPLSDVLSDFVNISNRFNSVLVRNLPFGITGPAMENLLWDYEFPDEENPQRSIKNLLSNPTTQSTLALITFRDNKNARRFVRNYHGRTWEKMMSRKEKALYEPTFCEIID